MGFSGLVNVLAMNVALRSFSLPVLSNHSAIHTTVATLKKRRPFYNRYAKQLLDRKKIYSGFGYEVLQQQEERILAYSEEREEEDFEHELLSEGKRRREAYIHSRKMRELQKGAGPRLLTWDQMEHVRFLKQTDPDEWDIRTLAHSFQVPELVIRKVLRSNKVLSPWLREKLDKKARTKQGIVRLPHASVDNGTTTTALTTTEENQNFSELGEWGIPNWKDVEWFKGYEKALIGNTRPLDEAAAEFKDNHLHKLNDGVSWLDDDECEFYEELYRGQDPPPLEGDGWDHLEEDDEQSDVINSDDGKSFFDSEGELVYKI